MILLLKAGDIEIAATAWSAGADPGQRVNVMAHGGTIGLAMTMMEFHLRLTESLGRGWLDLRELCETPEDTMKRLAGR